MTTLKQKLLEIKQEMKNENIEINEDLYNNLFEVIDKGANAVTLVHSLKHHDHCYCNQKQKQCWFCKFVQYVKYKHLEEEDDLLIIASEIWIFIGKIKEDMMELNKTDLDFLF